MIHEIKIKNFLSFIYKVLVFYELAKQGRWIYEIYTQLCCVYTNVMHKLKNNSYDKDNYNNFNVDSFRSAIKLWTKE